MYKHCVGIVVKNRWNLTKKTLESLYHSDQPKDSFDLIIIDNASNPAVSLDLKNWVQKAFIPVKNLITLQSPLQLAPAWNLFLNISTEYQFRTKLDNDLIFANTPVISPESPSPSETQQYSRGLKTRPGYSMAGGINPGAIPSASIQIGAGRKPAEDKTKSHTCFLDHLENTINQKKLGIAALVPVPPKQTLMATMPKIGTLMWRNHSCLVGACMTVTKQTFDKLGYFNEQLPRHIDWEYSQRAMAEGINIGYSDNYCTIDLGIGEDTLSMNEVQENELAAKKIGDSLPFIGFQHTNWEKVSSRIIKAMDKNMIVNLS